MLYSLIQALPFQEFNPVQHTAGADCLRDFPAEVAVEVQDELVFRQTIQVSGLLPAFTAGNPIGQSGLLSPGNPLDQKDDGCRNHNASEKHQTGGNGHHSLLQAPTDRNAADDQDHKGQVTGGVETLVILQLLHQFLFHSLKHSFEVWFVYI